MALYISPVYGTEAKLRWHRLVLVTLQYVFFFSQIVVVPVIVGRLAGVTLEETTSLLSWSLIAAAIATVIQALPFLGSGYLLPAVAAVPLFAVVTGAAREGGLELVAGVTILAGLLKMVLSPLIRSWKFVFVPQVAGFVLLLLGFWLGELGVRELFLPQDIGQLSLRGGYEFIQWASAPQMVWIGLLSLIVMSSIRYFSPRKFRIYSILCGLGVGWLLTLLLGYVPNAIFTEIGEMPWLSLPSWHPPTFDMSPSLWISLVLTTILAIFMSFALVESLQQGLDEPLRNKLVRRTTLLSGAGILISGLLGGVPQTFTPGSVAVSHTSGVYSRRVGYFYGLVLLIAAFSPRAVAYLLTIPSTVHGACLLYVAVSLVIIGGTILQLDRLTSTASIAIGVGFVTAMSVSSIVSVNDLLSFHGLQIAFHPILVGLVVWSGGRVMNWAMEKRTW